MTGSGGTTRVVEKGRPERPPAGHRRRFGDARPLLDGALEHAAQEIALEGEEEDQDGLSECLI